jgi:hypothetical protein
MNFFNAIGFSFLGQEIGNRKEALICSVSLVLSGYHLKGIKVSTPQDRDRAEPRAVLATSPPPTQYLKP